MIKIKFDDIEMYDSEMNTFYIIQGGLYVFEHSLKSISEWEAIYKKPFLSDSKSHSDSEMAHYCRLMAIDKEPPVELYTSKVYQELIEYIKDPQTATTLSSSKQSGSRHIITSEVVYAMMAEAGIPFECQYWNINRLLVLLNVIEARRNPKKMSQAEIYKQNSVLNAQRKAQLNTRG